MGYPNGCIYTRNKSPFWWAKIVAYKGAKAIFESTKRTRKDHGETYLKERLKGRTTRWIWAMSGRSK